MSNIRFNWERFWHPRGSSLNLTDGGYLPDPHSQTGRFANPQILSLSKIHESKALVLLGDPGMGKSTVLADEELLLKSTPRDPTDRHLFINLRSYQTETRVIADTFDSPILKDWLTGTHTLHLFLDSLDEGLLSVKVLASLLADQLKRLPSDRLRLRIACRTIEWPSLLEEGLAEWLGQEAVQYYVLAPLRKADVEESARASGLDVKAFLNQVESSGAVPFAIKPVTLKFLLMLSQKQGGLPSSQIELYLAGCRELVAEKSKSRIAAREAGQLSPDQRLAVAARIAACMVFGNRNAIYSGMDLPESSDEDMLLRDLSGGYETDNGARFTITEKEIRETLSTGLFSTRGLNRIGWGHQTYAEFLAAWHLKKHDVSVAQIKSLIIHPDDSSEKTIPQLGETAAWLAGMISEIFESIVQTEPDLLLRSEVATGDSQQRAALVEALLQLFEGETTFDRDSEHYQNLSHPGLANQLLPYIVDKTKGFIVRRVAIDITESCNVQSLNEAFLAVVLDPSDSLDIRVQAAYAIGRIGDDATRKRLKPLVAVDTSDDVRDELKGCVLRALWPFHITAAELFAHLKEPRSEGFVGAYRFFLSSELATNLTPEDLVSALQFISNLSQPRHEMDTSLESLMDSIVMKAWENLNEPGVTDALAKFVASRLKHHDALIRGKLVKTGHLTFLQDEDKRRRLLKEVLSVTAEDPNSEATWIVFTDTPIVRSEDFYWLISFLDTNPGSAIQSIVVDLLSRLFDRSPEHLDAIYTAGNKHPLVASKFNWVWEPILLDSAHVQQLKARHEKEEAWQRRRDKPPLSPSPAERLARALEECEGCNPSAWWSVTRELTLEPTSTNYSYGFEWNVMKLPGWVSADEATRERIAHVAEKYIQSGVPPTSNWLGTGQWSWSVMSQWSAVALLQNVRPMVMQNLLPDQIEKWCPIILAFPFLDNDSDRSVKEELLTLAHRKSPHAVLDTAKVLIEKEIEQGETIHIAKELNGIWDERIGNLLLQYAKSNETKPKSMGSLLSVLFAHDNLGAQSFATSLISVPPPTADPERARAVAAAQTLILDTKDAGWSIVWPAMQADEDFGKQIILGVCSDYASIGPRLNEDQLADLYVWLTHRFDSPNHPSGRAHWVGPSEHIDMWRNAIILLLTHRGSSRACDAIKRLQRELPELEWLKWVLVDAQTEARRATWVPPRPHEIIKLTADRKFCLIQSGDQLLELLIESLERFQSLLQGETPEAPYLWDNVSKSDSRPKDENMFSDYVKIFLEKDLKTKGIILNREVRIHRGQRTDIHVDAITQAAPGEPYDSITVIIECKGCWNPGLYDAMKDQLAEMYLKNNHCQHGLYLVGWFNCVNWSAQDGRKGQAERLCPKIDDTRQTLAASALELSNSPIRIRSVVLDASLH
ncbi:NACHT domain-containing protein [Nitrospira lenta]|uniref:NACHT domain-containing protein n=1 Tax=Nitrospira lenta TaxID=1436998 RepID=A0A330L4Q4_9BACT|nr:hypothetical protein [Nitrospira lenta]SPP64808.1 conserved hypothetical protein [Nitrospira lenta]